MVYIATEKTSILQILWKKKYLIKNLTFAAVLFFRDLQTDKTIEANFFPEFEEKTLFRQRQKDTILAKKTLLGIFYHYFNFSALANQKYHPSPF